jgi:CRISPR-associated protein Csd1
MLLQRLTEYAGRCREKIAPSGYITMPVTWIIPLGPQGELQGNLIRATGGGRRQDRGLEHFVPHRLRTSSAVRPKLLADTGEYVLGVPKNDSEKKKARAAECHEAFLELVRECAKRTAEPSVEAARAFLEGLRGTGGVPQLPNDFGPSDIATFRVGETFPIDLPSVRHFWAEYFWKRVLAGEAGEESEDSEDDTRESPGASLNVSPTAEGEMACIVCGKPNRPVPRHPFQIKGLPGRRAGAAIVSANVSAFQSYGLQNSLVAPTCKDCAESYAKAANLLIEGEEGTSIDVGLSVYIFWTKEPVEFSLSTLLTAPDPAEVRKLIGSARTGKKPATLLDETPFYAAALTANRSRVVVRDWLETTVGAVKSNLIRWFRLQAVVGEWGETDPLPLPIRGYKSKSTNRWTEGLAECTVPKIKRTRDTKKVSPITPGILLRVALKGGPLPTSLLFDAVKRNRAEQSVTRPRAALIKMVLLSQTGWNLEDNMEQLDVTKCNPGYLCGRLMGVLEAVQRAALPGLNATITDRFFGTASSAPASVFPRLIRGAQAHLTRLRKEKRGTYEALQRRLEEVMAMLPAFPKVLTLQDQGLFSLGYYHQLAADRAARIAAKEAREHEQKDIADQEGGKENA